MKSVCLRLPLTLLFANTLLTTGIHGSSSGCGCEDESGEKTPVSSVICIDGKLVTSVKEQDANGNDIVGSDQTIPETEGSNTQDFSPAFQTDLNIKPETVYRMEVTKDHVNNSVETLHYQFGSIAPGYVIEYKKPADANWLSNGDTTIDFKDLHLNNNFDANGKFSYLFRLKKLPSMDQPGVGAPSSGSISVPSHDTASDANGKPMALDLPYIRNRMNLEGASTTHSAGYLHWKLPVFGSSAPTPSLVNYSGLSGNGVTVKLDGNNDILQLWTGNSTANGTLVTLTQVNVDTLKILFFEDIAEPALSGSIYVAPAENTASRYQIIRRLTAGSGGYEMEIKQNGKVDKTAYIPVTNEVSWLVRTGDPASIIREEETAVTHFKDANGVWNKVQSITNKIGGQIVSSVTETYEVHENVGELMVERTEQVGGGIPNLVTKWTYHLDANEPAVYGKVKTIKYPDGSWVRYDYIGGKNSHAGFKSIEYRPWNDAPAEPGDATEENCHVTKWIYYSPQFSGGVLKQKPHKVEERVPDFNNYVTKDEYFYNNLSDLNSPETQALRAYLQQMTGNSEWESTTRHQYTSTTQKIKTTSYYYPNGNSEWSGRLAAMANADRTCETHHYERGNFNIGTGLFTPNTSGDYVRETITQGTLASPKGVANLTIRKVRITGSNDRPYAEQTYVYTGDDGNGDAQYEPLTDDPATAGDDWSTIWTYDFDTDGSVQKETVSQDERVMSETEYISDTETHYTNEAGIKTVNVVDAVGRTMSKIVKGKGGQVDRVTSYTYNGLVTVKTTFAGNLNLVESSKKDLAGRVVSETDQYGITVTRDYQNGGRTTVIHRPGGLSNTTDRYLDGRIKSQTGDTVVDVRYSYSTPTAATRLTRIEVGDGNPAPTARWQETLSDLAGRILEMRQPGPPDSQGGNPTITKTYYYDATTSNLLRTSSSAAETADRVFSYDTIGRQTLRGMDQDGNGILDFGGTDRITETEVSYHKENNLWWQKVVTKGYQTDNSATPTILQTVLTRLSANANGRASETKITNQAGNTDVTYTTINRVTATVTRTRNLFASTLDETVVNINGLVTSLTDSVSAVQQIFVYDALGREVSFTDARDATTRTSYNALGQIERKVDALGNVTRYTYYPANHMSAGRIQQIDYPEGVTVIRTYNNQGRILTEYGAGTYTKGYGYDAYGVRNILSTYKSGGANPDAITTWYYDAASGVLTAKKYSNNKQTQYEYDANGRLKKRIWARLDSQGQPLTTEYEYNNLGDLTKKKYSDATTDITFTPDRIGRTTGVIDAGGSSTITYNANNGELDEVSYASNHIFGQSSVKYDYTTNHHLPKSVLLKKESTTRQTWGYTWDDKGRNTTVFNVGSVSGANNSLTYSYGYLSETRRIQTVTSYFYTSIYATANKEIDKLGRLSSITNKNSGGAILARHGYTYDRANRRTEATLHDGSKWKYGYNSRSEVISAKKHQANGNVLAGHQFEYEFDGIGNRTKARYGGDGNGILGREISYTSNSVNQYTAISTPPAISVVGRAPAASNISINTVPVLAANRQGEHFFGEVTENVNTVPNGKWKQIDITDGVNSVTGHRWMAPENFSPTHDDDGNLTNDGRWNYIWNAENRLVKMETSAIARTVGAPWVTLEFVYDYVGRRISRKQTDKDSGGNVISTTEYHYRYSGWNCIARTSADWGEALYYTWGIDLSGTLQRAGGVGGLLGVRQESSGTTVHISSPCYDGNGNVVAYIDTTGNILTRYEYDPFGNLIRSGGAVNGEKELYLFSTKPIDPVSGLYYYGQRYYDPVTGRWPSRDSLQERGGINLYGMVYNSPLNWIDRLGWDAIPPDGWGEQGRALPPGVMNEAFKIGAITGETAWEVIKRKREHFKKFKNSVCACLEFYLQLQGSGRKGPVTGLGDNKGEYVTGPKRPFPSNGGELPVIHKNSRDPLKWAVGAQWKQGVDQKLKNKHKTFELTMESINPYPKGSGRRIRGKFQRVEGAIGDKPIVVGTGVNGTGITRAPIPALPRLGLWPRTASSVEPGGEPITIEYRFTIRVGGLTCMERQFSLAEKNERALGTGVTNADVPPFPMTPKPK